MSFENATSNQFNQSDQSNPSDKAALDDWQQMLTGVAKPQVAPVEVAANLAEMEPYEEEAEQVGELACALCHRYFPPEELTAASKERFNWEAAIVVCPECLTELKLEMRAKTKGADLLLGFVWAVVGFVAISIIIGIAIYSIRASTAGDFWNWIGAYFAVVSGFIIGRMVRYGVGRRHSLEQQLIAMFFTLAVALVTIYAGWIAYNNNWYQVVLQSSNQSVAFPPFNTFLSYLWNSFTNVTDLAGWQLHIGVDLGIIAGLVVAYFSSEGIQIYTRPFKLETA